MGRPGSGTSFLVHSVALGPYLFDLATSLNNMVIKNVHRMSLEVTGM